MSPALLDARHLNDDRDVIHRAVQALVEGKLVVLPTETVYGVAASALNPEAVEALREVKGRGSNHPMALAIKSESAVWDYIPHASPLQQRFARRCWPGPVTLVLNDPRQEGLLRQLPRSVREAVSPNGKIGFRVPAHPAVKEILELLAGPLVLTSANRGGEPDSTTAEGALQAIGSSVALILDGGPSRYGQASTVIDVGDGSWKLLREGVVGMAAVNRLASFTVAVVCTGNTCRSPMAEVLLKQYFARRIACPLRELEDRGFVVRSAGIAATEGAPASHEAVVAMAKRDLDLGQHASQPMGERLMKEADLILTMTYSHREALVAQWPDAAARTHLLTADGRDINDPYGGPAEIYEQCAAQIQRAIEERFGSIPLEELVPPRGE